MKTPLAWHNLLHNKVKTSVAVAGVVFAIVLMFMQLGFLEAVRTSATLIYEVLDFDVCIRSKDYLHLTDARTFPRSRLIQAAGAEGIRRGVPLTIAINPWRNRTNGENRTMLCFGVVPEDPVFRTAETQSRVRQLLNRPDVLLIDTRTRPEYGPRNGRQFGPQDHGTDVEISGNRMTIVGHYTLGAGLSASGTAIMNEQAIRRVSPLLAEGHISLGLLKVNVGQTPERVARRLQQQLRDDVDVKSRKEVLQGELRHWVAETNYGLIFQTGVVLAFVVGTAIVYQVLVSEVASLLPEYATLKAIGYGNRYLASVVLQQAIVLAVVGYAFGIAISQLLYLITSAGAKIPMGMTWVNAGLVFVLSLVMCICSGLGAVRKAFKADPADLF